MKQSPEVQNLSSHHGKGNGCNGACYKRIYNNYMSHQGLKIKILLNKKKNDDPCTGMTF